ncbi:hypothetical protein OSB04_015711 [Centaurea solstitialis]|uniref:NB-ARC domain-containing protein n=1 Tax=Centaurea solstitialis TaxID=347529 RepID=A0AA38TAN7_9ASTR|nr:hypothetical protein OSB04_015711 [Centaurea solstitialis]
MANADLLMFMDDLKKLIHGNHHPLINYNPLILSKRRRFKRLYQELDSIIQTLFSIHEDHHHNPDELEKVRKLKKRFKDATEEAQDTIDLFLSALHFRYGRLSVTSGVFKTSLDLFLSALHFTNRGLSPRSHVFDTSLDLEKILKSIESIKVELNTINISDMKADSSSRIKHVKTQSAAATETSYTRNPLGIKKQSEEFVVGLHHDVEIIRNKLTEDSKQLYVVSIVGMGGLGLDQATDSQLREKLHKNLMGRRYLVVIDDIWSIEAWDALKMFFPHDNTASRILLTSRLNEVALHMKPHGFVHYLPCLTIEDSWELLKQKVFHGNKCPEWLIKPGMQIAKKCHGLPLSVVVMAGVLAEESTNIDLWEEIACSVSSYIVGDQKGCLETIALSYHHIPEHLRECFLYLGGFPEDFGFVVKRLIWLWVAEGFIEEAGNRSLEDTAKAYLDDLISRNLVIVAKRNVNRDVKACKLHDLVRELCVQKAKEEGLFLKIDSPTSSSQLLEGITYKQRRIFTNQNVNILNIPHSLTRTIRTLLCFQVNNHSLTSIAHPFVLLRVLDLQESGLDGFPQGFALLVHLRYLAVWLLSEFPNSICKFWSLQTLILKRNTYRSMNLPGNITDLVNLRHLWSNVRLSLPYIEKPMSLHSISKVKFIGGVDNFHKCFPNIKKLELSYSLHIVKSLKSLELLPYLENLKLWGMYLRVDHIELPATLKKLTLVKCLLPWEYMSIIQLLPNLEVLKVCDSLRETGSHDWDACEQQFRQLKLLKLEWLDIEYWFASSTSFPCLKQLLVSDCMELAEIPLEIGEIATLEHIEINDCSNSVVESVKRIQQEQQDEGNDELKITVNRKEVSFSLSRHGSSESE